ncbi:Mannonate dehydratase [Lunatimonas lonarensis]|uniref:Mannonate dehydratase n=1 Tax=Lunatimonas lonarensis TaxID=1232681 RepID=R7ZTF3_9BACT|nr:mannonate dehydratase [Lunatimonas lonarensis]EON77426.1 Mannonate dehydratase [Lunatimonas lonarensis]
MSALVETWRWFGPNDPVSLSDIRQAGAKGVVSALHHLPHGEVWTVEEIRERKELIEQAGLEWLVVESVPVHEAIKTRRSDCAIYLENYRASLRNLASCGLRLVCYNFMPVLDWTRTDLAISLPNGAKALYFDWRDLAVFDLYELKREGAEKDYSPQVLEQVQERLSSMSPKRKAELSDIVLMGVPTEKGISLEELRHSIDLYAQIGKQGLRDNWVHFMQSIGEVCQEEGITMTMHPDDPPYAILGLPRIVSNVEDLEFLISAVPESYNAICFCTGSLGAGPFNNLPAMLDRIGDRVAFVHLRNVRKDAMGNFYESDHLDGDVDMVAVMEKLLRINSRRSTPIPFRPDHGHQMLDDLDKVTNPGYSAIGRLKGLAELRGLMLGLSHS